MRNQRQSLRAIRQVHRFLLQPNDVAGKASYLLGCERNPWTEVKGRGKGDAGIHQRTVLLVIAGEVTQEASTGELDDLLIEQSLLIETVTQPLLRHAGVQSQTPQHVVATQPSPVVGRRAGVDLEQTAVGYVGTGCCAGSSDVGPTGGFPRTRGDSLRYSTGITGSGPSLQVQVRIATLFSDLVPAFF